MAFSTLIIAEETSPPKHVQTQSSQAALSPHQALEKLKSGNQRYLVNQKRSRDYKEIAKMTSKKGQFPFAIVLNCIDSRSDPVVVFDQGLGNIFTAAVAGNVISPNMLGSIEYTINHAGTKLIVIMGHTHCGAVTAACTGGDFAASLQQLLAQIKPAVSLIKEENPTLSCKDNFEVNSIAKQNVINQMKNALEHSESVKKQVENHSVLLVGAMHNIALGNVQFFDIDGNPL